MSNPCANGGRSTLAQSSATPCLDHALGLHGRYIDLIENWEGLKGTFPGGQQAVYLHTLASRVLDSSERHDWGSDGDYESLPSTADLRGTLGFDFESIESELEAFESAQSAVLTDLLAALGSDRLKTELESRPYPDRLRATADLLMGLDLHPDGKQLLATLLANEPLFGVQMCLDAETHDGGSDAYLEADGSFRFASVGSDDVTAKMVGATVDYLKAVSSTLLEEFTTSGNIDELLMATGYLVKRINPTLGQGLIDKLDIRSLKQARDGLTNQQLSSIRSDMGSAVGNVLLYADQVAALVRLVYLFMERQRNHDLTSISKAFTDAMQVVAGLASLLKRSSKRFVENAAKTVSRFLAPLVNFAGVVMATLDVKDAWDRGDYSAMGGYALVGLGSVGLLSLDLFVAAGSPILGPAGLILGLVILAGTLIVIYTTDHQIETWFDTCVFGEAWARDADDFTDPDSLQFGWRRDGTVNYARQASDLIAMLRGLSVAESVAVGPSDHLVSFWTGTDIQLDVAATELNIPQADRDDYQYSVLELASPGFDDDTWVFIKRVRKVGNDWRVEPIYGVDVDSGTVHSLDGSTANALTATREYPNQTDANSRKLGIWLASKRLSEVYGLTKSQLEDDVWIEFDVTVVPSGTSTAKAKSFAADLETQSVARKRAFLEVE